MYKDILFSKYFNLFYEFLFQIYFRLHDKNDKFYRYAKSLLNITVRKENFLNWTILVFIERRFGIIFTGVHKLRLLHFKNLIQANSTIFLAGSTHS